MSSSDLEASYRATTFRVHGPRGNIDIRVASSSLALDEILRAIGASSWAYITAWNPRSQPTLLEINAKAHVELVDYIRQRGFVFYEGDGIPDNSEWAPEHSVWIAGIDRQVAIGLGVRFEQNAILVGKIGEAAELVCCGLEDRLDSTSSVGKRLEVWVIEKRFVMEPYLGGMQIGEVENLDMSQYVIVKQMTQAAFDKHMMKHFEKHGDFPDT